MTLKQLQEQVQNNTQVRKLPSYSKLIKQKLPVLLQKNNGTQELVVYNNGLATYSDLIGGKIRHTVYSITNPTLGYEFSTHSCPPIKISDYPELLDYDAFQILSMCGQDRLDQNTYSRESYHAKGSLDNNGNYYEGASNTRKSPKDFFSYDFTNAVINSMVPDAKEHKIQKLHKAIEKLTPKQKEVIDLYFYQKMPQEKIALKLGISRASVQDRLDGAIKKLKKYMER